MKLKNILLSGILAGSLALGSCTKFEDSEIKQNNYELINVSETILGQGYERPGGLSSNKKGTLKSFDNQGSLETQLFCSSPVINLYRTDFLVKPKIYTNSPDLSSQNILYELSNVEVDDFLGGYLGEVYVDGIRGWRPGKLILDLITLPDNSIILSSNNSDKLYRIYNDETKYKEEIYLENDSLVGITDMILGSDNNIYAVKNIPKNKEVISIDIETKEISHEFSIPDGVSTSMGSSVIGKMDIIENTLEGRILNNSKYYVLDQLTKTIYNVSDSKVVTPLKDKLRYPSSLAIDDMGRIITTLGPTISSPDFNFLEYPQVIAINPSTLKQDTIYNFFNDNPIDYHVGILSVDNNQISPISFYMTSLLCETDTDFDFYFTKSLTGEIGKITATKDEINGF
ncbi:hypothetical protein KAI04_00515 [Candidatus Pacearchaeota archaeon]|nr:hypothetical protein [Candidatus Pacearchaeota archaeon]